jgi:hypothetical protein
MTPLGRIECAVNGCVECHDSVLESFKIESELLAAIPGHQPSEYFQEEVDYVAFRQAKPLKRSGRPRQTDKEILKELEIGRYAEIIYRQGKKKGISVEQALEITAEKFFVSVPKVRDARKEFLASLAMIQQEAENRKNSDSQDK